MRLIQPLFLLTVLLVACSSGSDSEETRSPQDRARDLIIEAQEIATTGNTPKAAELLARSLALDPDHVGAWHRLGEMRLLSGLDGVFEALDRAQAMGLDSARFHQTRGEAYEAEEQDSQAKSEFAMALEREPFRKEAWFRLAQVERRLGNEFAAVESLAEFARIDQAERSLMTSLQAAEAQPEDAMLAAATASAHLEMGYVEEAQEWVDRAFALRNNIPEAHMVAGRIARLQGDPDTALVHFELVTSLSQYDPRPWIERSEMALSAGDHQAARNYAHQATDVAGADPRVFLAQARILIALDALDDALASCEAALLRDPKREETLQLHAHIWDLMVKANEPAGKDD